MGPWRSCPSSAELNPAKLTFKKIFDEFKFQTTTETFLYPNEVFLSLYVVDQSEVIHD